MSDIERTDCCYSGDILPDLRLNIIDSDYIVIVMIAEPDYRLLSYRCGCAATIPLTDVSPDVRGVAEPLRIGQYRIMEHQPLNRDCEDEDCEGRSRLEYRKEEVHRLERLIRRQLRRNSAVYHRLGQRYHSCLLRTRARLEDDPTCDMAHEQFAISSTPREEDPFFEIDEEALEMLSTARLSIEGSKQSKDIEYALSMTHEALFYMCLKENAIQALKRGVDVILSSESKATRAASPVGENARKELPPKKSPRAKVQRDPQFTWPAYRWSMYKSRGLEPKDASPIKMRKLGAHAHRRGERERLFQKMIYGNWIARVGLLREGDVDMYAIWPPEEDRPQENAATAPGAFKGLLDPETQA